MDKNKIAEDMFRDSSPKNVADASTSQDGFRSRSEDQADTPLAGRRSGSRINPELLRNAGDSISDRYPLRNPVNSVKDSAEDSDEQLSIDTASVASTLMNARKKPPIVQRLIDNAQQSYSNSGHTPDQQEVPQYQNSAPSSASRLNQAPQSGARPDSGSQHMDSRPFTASHNPSAQYGAKPHAPVYQQPAAKQPAAPTHKQEQAANLQASAYLREAAQASVPLKKVLEEQFASRAAASDTIKPQGHTPKFEGSKTPVYTPGMVKNGAVQPGGLDIKIGDEVKRSESAEDIFIKALMAAQNSDHMASPGQPKQVKRDVLPGSIIKDGGSYPKAPVKSFDPSNILVSRNSPGKTLPRTPVSEKPEIHGPDKADELFRLSTSSATSGMRNDPQAYSLSTRQFGYAAAGDGRESIDIENTRRILEELRKINSESEMKSLEKKSEPERKKKFFRARPFQPMYVALVAVVGIVIGVSSYALMNRFSSPDDIPDLAGSESGSQATSKIMTHSAEYDIQQVFADIVIKNPDLTLKNAVVENSLIIDKNVGEGDVYLEDVVIKGALYVKGGGPNSIHMKNVIAPEVIITKEGGGVRLVAEGASNIAHVDTLYPAVLVNAGLSDGFSGFRQASISPGGNSDCSLELVGVELEQLVIGVPSIIRFSEGAAIKSVIQPENASFYGGQIGSLTISSKQNTKAIASGLDSTRVDNITVSTPAVLNLSGSTTISNLSASRQVDINGRGIVGNFSVNSHTPDLRVGLNIKAVDINNLYVATPVTLRADENSTVSSIMAKSSLYITGKGKVYSLIAGADDIQYEIRPDMVLVAEGALDPIEMYSSQPGSAAGEEEQPSNSGSSSESGNSATASAESGSVFTRGKGTREEPYEVSTPEQLNAVRSHLRSHFIQTADIDMLDSPDLANNFNPIAPDSSHIFTGVYDGGGHKIKNLRIESDRSNVGLFGYVSGEIRNLGIGEGSSIISKSENTVYVGGIAGVMYKTAKVYGCYNAASVSSHSAGGYIGGLVGYSYSGHISESYNLGTVKGSGSVGGIIGMNHTSATLINCYNAGTVSGSGDIGSIAGYNYSSTIKNSYYLTVSASNGIGKGTGDAYARSADEMKTKKLADDLNSGSDLWMQATGTFPFPQLRNNMQER